MESVPTILYATASPDDRRLDDVASALRTVFTSVDLSPVATLEQCRAELADGDPLAVVTESAVDGATGAEVIAAVRETAPSVPVVLYAEEPSPELVVDAYDAGATATVQRTGESGDRVLAETLRREVDGTVTCDGPSTDATFEALVDAIPDAVVVVDADSVVRFANRAVEDVFGYPAGDLVGEPLTRLMDEERSARHLAGIERYLETGERSLDWSGVELTGRHRDGEEIPLHVSFAELHRDGERLFTGVIRDLGDRRAAELERARNEAMLDTISDGIYALDTDDRFVAVNEAYAELTGFGREELLGEPASTVTERLSDDDLTALERALETDEEVASLEASLPATDGETTPVEVRITPFETAPGEVGRVGVVRDVSERKQLERELADVLERITDAFFALDEDWRFTYVNERAAELLQQSREELLGRVVWDEFSEAVGTTFEEEYRHAMTTNESVTFEEFYPPLDAWFEVNAYPSETGLSVYFRDVTARKRAERRREERVQQFETLNERARRLADAETREAVCEETVAAASEALDLPYSCVALYDEASGDLSLVAATDEARTFADDSLFGDPSGPVWESFIRDEQRITDVELEGVDRSPWSVAAFPLGDHGVYVTLTPGGDAFGETDLLVAELLCANARSALDRAAREADLRTQRDRLEEKNDRLERVNRINRAIREITQVLIRADSREETERLVCEKLAAIDPFRFVWIGHHDATTDRITPAAAAGEGQTYLEEITVTADDARTGQGPAGRAVREGRSQVQNSLLKAPEFEPWREAALSYGFRSSISVPIQHRETLYGVLNIYAGTPMTFEEMEVTVLEELGRIIGYAMSAIERKRALVSESSVELTFRVSELDAPLFGFIDGTAGEFELENAVRRIDGHTHLFFTGRGVAFDRIREAARSSPDVERLTLVSTDDDECLFECTVRDSTFVSNLLDRGGVLAAVDVEGGAAELTFRLPKSADVREFVGSVESAFGGAELVARREYDDPVMSRGEFESEVRNRLTERQEEVIRTAYFAGFFDWPRKSNGQEVAEMLGVTQPTVNRHIRGGERSVFGLLFDDDA